MSQYNKLSDIQYAKFHIRPVDLHFGLFWSAGIPIMPYASLCMYIPYDCDVDTQTAHVSIGSNHCVHTITTYRGFVHIGHSVDHMRYNSDTVNNYCSLCQI